MALSETIEVWEYVAAQLVEEAISDISSAVTYDYIEKHRPPATFLDPSSKVNTWALTGGRGGAKTFCAALYFDEKMRSRPGVKGRIIAPTVGEAIESCVTGNSGVCTLFPDVTMRQGQGSTKIVRWPNGSEAAILGAWSKAEVRKLRAISNREIDWFEEFTHIPLMEQAWEQAAYGRRIGSNPQAIISTTPTAHPFWAKVLDFPSTVHTHATMFDNPYLNDQFKEIILEQFGGTALAGQEIWGEILTDVKGALWNSENLNQHRIALGDSPVRTLTCVGVDPAVGSGTTGIVVAGSFKVADRWHLAAFDDYSLTDSSPEEWGRNVVRAFVDYDADYVIAEGNQGLRMVASTIKNAADNWETEDGSILTVPVKMVNARDNKQTRAQPVSMLFEQGRGHIVGRLPLMENQLTTWVPDGGMDSPDRLDALVWACTWLQERFRRGRGQVSAPARVRVG